MREANAQLVLSIKMKYIYRVNDNLSTAPTVDWNDESAVHLLTVQIISHLKHTSNGWNRLNRDIYALYFAWTQGAHFLQQYRVDLLVALSSSWHITSNFFSHWKNYFELWIHRYRRWISKLSAKVCCISDIRTFRVHISYFLQTKTEFVMGST